MKKTIVVLILIFICACAPQQTLKKKEVLPPPIVSAIPTQTPDKSIVNAKKELKPLFGKLLSDVTTSKQSFNPSQKQETAVSFHLAKPAKITLNVYDPDLGLIKTIVDQQIVERGKQTFVWDGKDPDGRVVPDEAYFFTIIAENQSGAREIYDPTTFSGGEEHDITVAKINPLSQTITYKMPEMGRVMIRLGIQGGPLMNTLVDWQPRVKGMITEYWNRKDKDNLVDIHNNPKFKMIISYFGLPENSVIAFGNKSLTYRDYKKTIAAKRPLKKKRMTSVVRFSHHYQLPRTMDYSPDLRMTFSNTQGKDEKGVPILKGKTLVKVVLDEQDKLIFQNQQFEICFFLDYKFYAEDESGYTPFNWVWDLSNVAQGEYLLTVNISGFKDQIGVLSRKVKVVK